MKDFKDMQSKPILKQMQPQKFFYNFRNVVCSRRFLTVQFLMLLFLESVVIFNFVFGHHNWYNGFNYFWFNFSLFASAIIIINALTCAGIYKCSKGRQFLGYLLMNYFIATIPCTVILMIVYSKFNIQGFLNIEGGQIVLFLIFAAITSLFYRYLYDNQTASFKYPANLSKTGKYLSAICVTLGIALFVLLLSCSLILDKLERMHEFTTCESELTSPVSENYETQFISFVGHQQPKHAEDISLYVDFSRTSDNKRFAVYDNKKNEIIAISKCSHGCGQGSTIDKPVFSNDIGSNCSSLGEYRVAEIDKMKNGFPCIRIDGLDKTNSNARKRGIVIHELPIFTSTVFDDMKIPLTKYISSGCFAIAPEVFKLLINLRKEGKTMYLYATN